MFEVTRGEMAEFAFKNEFCFVSRMSDAIIVGMKYRFQASGVTGLLR
jgi:hypothetical protein